MDYPPIMDFTIDNAFIGSYESPFLPMSGMKVSKPIKDIAPYVAEGYYLAIARGEIDGEEYISWVMLDPETVHVHLQNGQSSRLWLLASRGLIEKMLKDWQRFQS